jgi:hypothetical protein
MVFCEPTPAEIAPITGLIYSLQGSKTYKTPVPIAIVLGDGAWTNAASVPRLFCRSGSFYVMTGTWSAINATGAVGPVVFGVWAKC